MAMGTNLRSRCMGAMSWLPWMGRGGETGTDGTRQHQQQQQQRQDEEGEFSGLHPPGYSVPPPGYPVSPNSSIGYFGGLPNARNGKGGVSGGETAGPPIPSRPPPRSREPLEACLGKVTQVSRQAGSLIVSIEGLQASVRRADVIYFKIEGECMGEYVKKKKLPCVHSVYSSRSASSLAMLHCRCLSLWCLLLLQTFPGPRGTLPCTRSSSQSRTRATRPFMTWQTRAQMRTWSSVNFSVR